ncbi:hypothetical protein [Shewanella sp. 10B]|uniref:hypothetical protein n=1 Tax=Shewanella TaxID=22 RepID=UPI000B349A8D|nr:hypothetical protein [Shewanella sp. 10B]AYV11538.1 hypothetical protein EEY24_00790 [Shewanella algae]QXN27435.1 hypothetical protein KVP08_023370 [Shewanella putrefaciens]
MDYTTVKVAEHMITTGRYYSAALLGKELGMSAQQVSGKLYNIRTSCRYQCEVTALPNRLIKMLSINGRTSTRTQLVNAFLKLL